MVKQPYTNVRWLGGIASLAGGVMSLAIGFQGETMFIYSGILVLACGIYLMYSLSKK